MPAAVTRPARKLIVVMGVAGSGKSTLGLALASRLGVALIEGDDLHTELSHARMAAGIALDDDDRAPWLDRLGATLAASPADAVATCSALKRRYRDRLRGQVPGLRFVCIAITRADAERRVSTRAGHFFPAALVATQFAAFEAPDGEADVLTVSAREPAVLQAAAALRWLEAAR